jgi:hypothetical protein
MENCAETLMRGFSDRLSVLVPSPYAYQNAFPLLRAIIAILAILAAAIAAGSSSFSGGTSREKAKIMASTIISQMNNIDNCVNVVRSNGFEDTQLDFEVPANSIVDAIGNDNSYPTTSPAGCTSDACGVFKSAGGGCIPQVVALTPEDAVDQTFLNVFWAQCSAGNNAACRENFPWVLQFQIEGGANAPLHLAFGLGPSINKDVCMEINTLAGVANPSGDAPHGGGTAGGCGAYDCNVYGASWSYDSSATFTSSKDFCYWDTNDTHYYYVHVLN